MSVNVVYTTSAIAVGGRDGNTGTTEGRFEVKLARPKELGGKGDGNNPVQLFASGYAACFRSSMQLLASQGEGKVRANAEVMGAVGFGPCPEGGLGLEIALDITLPEVARREAETLVEKAHQICAYSNATRSNVAIRLALIEVRWQGAGPKELGGQRCTPSNQAPRPNCCAPRTPSPGRKHLTMSVLVMAAEADLLAPAGADARLGGPSAEP